MTDGDEFDIVELARKAGIVPSAGTVPGKDLGFAGVTIGGSFSEQANSGTAPSNGTAPRNGATTANGRMTASGTTTANGTTTASGIKRTLADALGDLIAGRMPSDDPSHPLFVPEGFKIGERQVPNFVELKVMTIYDVVDNATGKILQPGIDRRRASAWRRQSCRISRLLDETVGGHGIQLDLRI